MKREHVQKGFTLIEVIMTVVIMGMLASVAIPTYTKLSARSKIAGSQADLQAIKNAFVNYYYETMLSGSKEFPPEPGDGNNLLDSDWGAQLLTNSKTAITLFSTGQIPLNPNNNPYKYVVLSNPDGFSLEDLDYKVKITFEP